MFVKPNPDRTVVVHKHGTEKAVEVPMDVLHPHTRTPIPAVGREVPEDIYWMRRLRDGDVVSAEPAAPVADPEPVSVLGAAPEAPPAVEHGETEQGA